MNILLPMAGAGQRFSDAGYKIHKPAIPTIDYRDGKEYPMVVCAVRDLPGVEPNGGNIIFVDRDFHKFCGVEDEIKLYFPNAHFVTTTSLTEGQASTCLLAKDFIDNDEELLIAGCDNGMIFDKDKFEDLKPISDLIVFTYTHNDAVLANPDSYGWMIADKHSRITDVSIKKAVSSNPENDHAVVATFWFKKGASFVRAAKKMILENDRINGEFYVDEVVKHCISLGQIARIFDIERYIGWGTPYDYEIYMNNFKYWKDFIQNDKFLQSVI